MKKGATVVLLMVVRMKEGTKVFLRMVVHI